MTSEKEIQKFHFGESWWSFRKMISNKLIYHRWFSFCDDRDNWCTSYRAIKSLSPSPHMTHKNALKGSVVSCHFLFSILMYQFSHRMSRDGIWWPESPDKKSWTSDIWIKSLLLLSSRIKVNIISIHISASGWEFFFNMSHQQHLVSTVSTHMWRFVSPLILHHPWYNHISIGSTEIPQKF